MDIFISACDFIFIIGLTIKLSFSILYWIVETVKTVRSESTEDRVNRELFLASVQQRQC